MRTRHQRDNKLIQKPEQQQQQKILDMTPTNQMMGIVLVRKTV